MVRQSGWAGGVVCFALTQLLPLNGLDVRGHPAGQSTLPLYLLSAGFPPFIVSRHWRLVSGVDKGGTLLTVFARRWSKPGSGQSLFIGLLIKRLVPLDKIHPSSPSCCSHPIKRYKPSRTRQTPDKTTRSVSGWEPRGGERQRAEERRVREKNTARMNERVRHWEKMHDGNFFKFIYDNERTNKSLCIFTSIECICMNDGY